MGKIVGIIPARWASTRFPGKPLHPIAGKPLIQHVWERCREAARLDRTIIATDDMRIAEAAFGFGAEVALTGDHHPSGTDRIAEVAARLGRARFARHQYPGGRADDLARAHRPARLELRRNRELEMVTAANVLDDLADLHNPNCVKVVLAKNGRRPVLFAQPDPASLRRRRRLARPSTATRVFTATRGDSSPGSSAGNLPTTSWPSAWNNSGLWSTGWPCGC